jgi:molecular chaperone DnaJ
MNNDNYYGVLGVDEKATQDDIKKAYRNLAKENHPDKGGDEEKFKKINEAYDTIGDEVKRKNYDNRKNNPFGGNFSDMFNMFNQQRQRQENHTSVITVNIGVLDSYLSRNKQITYKRKTNCNVCTGTGGEKRICTVCNGVGSVMRQMGSGMFVQVVNMACETCSGTGKITINACYGCSGSGTKDEMKTLDIKIPHGIEDGQFIRMSNVGDFKNGRFGDLVVRINLMEENGFFKNGPHLVYNSYLKYEDLMKEDINIPHPDGELNIKLPKLMDSSKPLRVRGKGFKVDQLGDLLINQIVRFERP